MPIISWFLDGVAYAVGKILARFFGAMFDVEFES